MSGEGMRAVERSAAVVAADRCPLCGGDNACAMARGGDTGSPCWCVGATFDDALLARVPAPARGRACICAACAAAAARSES